VAIYRDSGRPELSHTCNFDQRRRPEMLRTAMATAFLCPTSTTGRLPRVTPVFCPPNMDPDIKITPPDLRPAVPAAIRPYARNKIAGPIAGSFGGSLLDQIQP
jgi:hypothetical protein